MESRPYIVPTSALRPAAVLVIDLVRHSLRMKPDVQRIQAVVEEVFRETLMKLGVEGVLPKYTGDGYLLAFVGDSSARVIDFANIALPALTRRLSGFEQTFRAGLDFGLLLQQYNRLTGGYEHFDEPGIQAARLEPAAEQNQVLCSEIVYQLFSRHYPSAFLEATVRVMAKDRVLTAYPFRPFDLASLAEAIRCFVHQEDSGARETIDSRNGILVVDDNVDNANSIVTLLELSCPWSLPIAYTDPQLAVAAFRPEMYGVAIVDYRMPRMSGCRLTERLLTIDPKLSVIMTSGDAGRYHIDEFFNVGGLRFMCKPADPQQLIRWVRLLMLSPLVSRLKDLSAVCSSPDRVIAALNQMADDMPIIQNTSGWQQVSILSEPIRSILKSKGSNLLIELCQDISDGTDIELATTNIASLLSSLATRTQILWDCENSKNIIDNLINNLTKSNVAVQISYASTVRLTKAGSILVFFILREIVSNAINAVGPQGRLAITVDWVNGPPLLRVMVQDSGLGIPDEIIHRVFEAGFTTQGIGRGMGLYLVREVVRTLGGDVTYRFLDGAIFKVIIPLAPAHWSAD